MTPDIDSMTGRELDEAVAIASGWKWWRTWRVDTQRYERYLAAATPLQPGASDGTEPLKVGWDAVLPYWHTDTGAAFGLLMGLDEQINIQTSADGESITVLRWDGTTDQRGTWVELATGPKADAAATMVRAWLKVQARKGE